MLRNSVCVTSVLLAIACLQSRRSVSAADWDCKRPWPQLDLFLPVNLDRGTTVISKRRYYEFEQLFLRSFMLFWPHKVSNTSLNVIVDEERTSTAEYRELVSTIGGVTSRIPGGSKISSLPLLKNVYRKGYDRQQHAMFWADNFTNRFAYHHVLASC